MGVRDEMTIQFTKANAVNNAQAREAHHDLRRSAGTKRDGKAAELARVKGGNDGQEVEKDAELVLYEFVALLVRIAFQRANPTFGNHGNKRPLVGLPGCLQRMLEEDILPRARMDTSAAFRETVMAELSVKKVLADYRERLRQWYDYVTSDAHKATASSTNLLQMDHRLTRPTGPRNTGWVKHFNYAEASLLERQKVSNRLTETRLGGTTTAYSTGGDGYDEHGNLLRMEHLSTIQWNPRDQLRSTSRQRVNDQDPEGEASAGETTYYVYDSAGERVRKVTERAGGLEADPAAAAEP